MPQNDADKSRKWTDELQTKWIDKERYLQVILCFRAVTEKFHNRNESFQTGYENFRNENENIRDDSGMRTM
jgi:hypothetical protein